MTDVSRSDTHMTGLDGGHEWDSRRHVKRAVAPTNTPCTVIELG